MTLEELARSAVADLWAETERTLDVEDRLSGLRHARNRARVGWVAAVAVAALVLLLVVTAPWPHRRALPAAPTRPATVESLVFQNGTGLRVVGPSLPALTGSVKAGVPAPMSFSPDGSTLAYGAGDVHVVDVKTGADRKLGRCRQPSCPVAWSPDSAQVVTASPQGLVRIPLDGGKATVDRLPAGWSVTGLDVNGAGRVALAGMAEGEGALMAVDLSGTRPAVLFKAGHYSLGDPRWTPDGSRFWYLQWREPQYAPGLDALITVASIRADGQDLRFLAQVGKCQCTPGVRPWMDVSPTGRLAVSTLTQGRRAVV